MKILIALFTITYLVLIVNGQFFDTFGTYNQFENGLDARLQATRDPRQNNGPVVFPPAPSDSGETSGVVVGASGYGFVPPNGPRGSGPRRF